MLVRFEVVRLVHSLLGLPFGHNPTSRLSSILMWKRFRKVWHCGKGEEIQLVVLLVSYGRKNSKKVAIVEMEFLVRNW